MTRYMYLIKFILILMNIFWLFCPKLLPAFQFDFLLNYMVSSVSVIFHQYVISFVLRFLVFDKNWRLLAKYMCIFSDISWQVTFFLILKIHSACVLTTYTLINVSYGVTWARDCVTQARKFYRKKKQKQYTKKKT